MSTQCSMFVNFFLGVKKKNHEYALKFFYDFFKVRFLMLKIRPQVGKFYKRMIKKSREIACFLSKRLQKIEGSRSEDSSSSID